MQKSSENETYKRSSDKSFDIAKMFMVDQINKDKQVMKTSFQSQASNFLPGCMDSKLKCMTCNANLDKTLLHQIRQITNPK